MILKVETSAGTVRAFVFSKIDAARFLRQLAKDGQRCVRWELER